MDRKRLTITIKKSLIDKIDSTIDGARIRNRSHAIEYLLSKAVKPSIKQAVILAGGKGVKMRPLTYELPKALIPVSGKPLVEYTVELLRDAGIRDIILAIGYLGDKIRQHFGNGSKFGVNINYSSETKNLGTAGAIANSYPLLEQSSFIVVHGDILIDIDVSDFIKFHKSLSGTISTIVLSTAEDPRNYGNVLLQGNNVVKFIEKPTKKQTKSHLVSAGLYLFEHNIFDYIPEKMPAMLEDVFPKLAKEGKLGGYLFDGKWFDISTPKNYEKAISEWTKTKT